MDKNEFVKELKKLNITINEEQLNKLDKYYHLLVEWNEKINLTRIIEEKEVYLKHYYDSLTIFRVINLEEDLELCDIGTGAGFPGIVLKIMFPKLKITLIDSLLKRIKFLNVVINELQLDNIKAIHIRAEDFAKQNKNTFDVVTSRAVCKLKELLDYSIPILKHNGYFIPMKANCEEEVKEAMIKIKRQKLKIEKTDEFYLPIENSKRTIIKIKKCL